MADNICYLMILLVLKTIDMILFGEIQAWKLLFLIEETGYNAFCITHQEAAGKLNIEVIG